MKSHVSLSILALVLGAFNMSADVKLPTIFGDHMVLQQDGKIPVWGWADPGEKVTVTIGSDHADSTAGSDGSWRVDLAPLPTNATPVTMTVAGKNTVTFQDVLVGEVWLASGQSNMEFPIAGEPNAKDIVAQANNPQLRIYFVNGHPSLRPWKQGAGHWAVFNPGSAAGMSAVAYFFALELQKKLNRPIGVLQATWGGTWIETWTSAEALKNVPGKQAGLDAVAAKAAAFPEDPAAQDALIADFHKRDNDWVQTVEKAFHIAHDQWEKDRDAAKAANKPVPNEPSWPNTRPKNPDGEGGEYTTLYNGMIHPLMPYAIKGAIWYQGEANSGDNNQYDLMLCAMITDWRAGWGYNFTFLPVTLANIGERYPTPTDNGWAEVRDDEEKVCEELPNAGTAEAIDVGTAHNIHPSDKIDVGKRLAAQALRIAYGQKIVSSGPRFESMSVEGDKIRIKYRDVGSGLMLAVSPFVSNDPPNENPALPTTAPLSFDIAGVDHKWVVAQAQIDGNDVLVSSDQVPQPVAVRYGWAQNPQINLYNKEGFPAVPFRTRDWPAEAK
jgi:sialate O-acetylesterase